MKLSGHFLTPPAGSPLVSQDFFKKNQKSPNPVYKHCSCKTNLFVFKAHAKFMLMLKT